MSRYIDADALIITIRELPNTPNGFSDVYDKAYIIGVIEEVPTADVVEVVRCKDCKLFEQNGEKEFGNCPHHQCLAYLTDFCSWGERREDGE